VKPFWIFDFRFLIGTSQNNKVLVLALSTLLLSLSGSAEAQQPTKIPRIGYVSGTGDPSNPGPNLESFREGMRELGYIDGKNIAIEYRYAQGNNERFASLATELVQLKLDVIVIVALPAIRAAKQATNTIPIVIVTSDDPVANGLVDSLARPGGNITGVTQLTRDLSGKRLELLKEILPRLSRVGILVVGSVSTNAGWKEYQTAADVLKVQLRSLELRSPEPDLEGAFQAAAKARINALITIRNPTLIRRTKRIADFAMTNRLPSMFESSDYVNAGGLVSYGANSRESFRRAAVYVDKILKGYQPADLPVEQPTKFELVINLKTAKQIGLTIPPTVLARADKVIR
jgi:putative ABC transport system substrate-binding protein